MIAETRIVTKRLHDRPDDSWTVDGAIASGAYEALRAVLAKADAADVQEQVKLSGLRGRGGAGFPTAQKWSFLPPDLWPRYLVINADEGEPSTFKDRMLVERDPHQLVEGIAIAAYAIQCNTAFVYLRGEFALGYERLTQAIVDAKAKGFLGSNIQGSGFDLDIVVHRGAGAYICGEETALLNSLEGERGMPRIRPPFPAIAGLYAKPTVVNNVETLSTVPHIVTMGGAEYAKLGVNRSTGTRLFSVSGHVNRPGNYEVELGVTFRDLIFDIAGGIPGDRKVKFFIPGGASSQWLTGSDEHLDAPLDMDFVQQTYSVMLGSGAVMVFDETVDPLLVAWRLAKFFAHESCGKCTPCREGTGWVEKVLYRMSHGLGRPEDLDLLFDIGGNISPGVMNAPFIQTTICPLGPSVVSGVASLHRYFRAEIEARYPGGSTRVTTTEPKPEVVKDTVTVTVDGVTFEAPKGELLIKAAQEHGVYIPRFCWHERMKPVGMCRMCLVEVEGVRGFPPACTTPVAEGMVCNTQSDAVKKIQDGVLEFLLVNHPLDCPVCDRGGECPLQDQTLAFGPGESRFIEEKRHFEKPIELSDLVLLDRERCIQCGRCTRFADEIAGDPLIDFVERGDHMQVLNFADQPFDSYFSGNTVQICPVGALTARQYRFKARPWDLETVETSCNSCSVQCRGALQSSSNRLVRLLGVDSEPVNHGWLCDKGRYGIEWVHSDKRVVEPHRRVDGALRQVSWPEALDEAASLIKGALEQHGPGSIALLGGARGTNEDAYAFARLMKGVIGTDNVDAQIGDGLPAEVVLGVARAEIADCDRAAAIVLLGPDLEEELPVLHLRVRRAAVELGVPIVDLAAVAHGLTEYATTVARSSPGEDLGSAALEHIREARGDRPGPVVVVLGRASLADSVAVSMRAARTLRDIPGVKFLSALRRGNVHGAIDSGLVPGFLPGRVSIDSGREWFEPEWGSRVPRVKGFDARGILEAAAAGKVEVLVINGSDPVADFPDADLARRGMAGAKHVIAVGGFLTGTSSRSDVVLPCTLWGEKTGSLTNLEGRVQRVGRKVAPEGTAMDDWRIAGELALRLGTDFDFATVDEVTDELARVAPALAGVDSAFLRRARDGVVLPLSEHRDEVVLRTRALSILADDGSGTSWDPIKVEGEVADIANAGDGDEAAAVEADGPEGDAPQPVVAPVRVAPELWQWDGAVPDADVPPRDAYSLRLVVGRRLYDNGRMVSEAPVLERVRRPFPLRVNPHDAAGLGVESGAQVRVTSTRGSQVLTIETDGGVPAGIAQLDFAADGAGAAALIDAGSAITDLRVETLR